MDEGHRPEAGLRGCTGAANLETLLDRFEEGPQHRLDACPERRRRKLRIMLEEIAQAFGQGEDPLPYRHLGKQVVHQMRTAVSAMRRVVLIEGQIPRPLQE